MTPRKKSYKHLKYFFKNRTLPEKKLCKKKITNVIYKFFYLWILFRGGTGQQLLFSTLLNATCLKRNKTFQTLEIFEICSKMDLFEGFISKPTYRIEHRIKYREEFAAPSLLYVLNKNKKCYSCIFIFYFLSEKLDFFHKKFSFR